MTQPKTNAAAIVIPKGGVLKTTLTVSIAAEHARTGTKTIILEFDSQGDNALTFGKNPNKFENTVYDVLYKGLDYKEALVELSKNLYLLPSNDDMDWFEIDVLTDKTGKADNFFGLLKPLVDQLMRDGYLVIMDTPPKMGLVLGNIFNAAKEVVLPFHPEKYCFNSLVKAVKTISAWAEDKNPGLTINAVVPVKVKSTNIHKTYLDLADTVLTPLKIKITEVQIPESTKFPDVVSFYNLPITLIDEDSAIKKKELGLILQYQKYYRDLVKELKLI